MTNLQLLRRRQVLDLVLIDASTLWRWTKRGEFPAPLRIGKNSVRWRAIDIEEWQARQRAKWGSRENG